jgi:PhnB protein
MALTNDKGADSMELSPYLSFNGSCEEAFRVYERVLGGRIESLFTFGDSPAKDQVPPDWAGKVMHARMVVDESVLMGSDAPPPNYTAPQGTYVSIGTRDADQAHRIFTALAEGGKVVMPFEDVLVARVRLLVDRFGTNWMVNAEPGESAV